MPFTHPPKGGENIDGQGGRDGECDRTRGKIFGNCARTYILAAEMTALAADVVDTVLTLGAGIYRGDLAYYHGVRQAGRHGIAGTEAIDVNLQTRFPGGGGPGDADEPEPSSNGGRRALEPVPKDRMGWTGGDSGESSPVFLCVLVALEWRFWKEPCF